MYNFLCLYYCSYFFQFLAFTRISKFLLKMLKVHKKMVIINFANKWEIIIIRDKKNRDKFFARWKKNRGKRKSGKNLATCKKFSHFSPTFFSPIRYLNKKLSLTYQELKTCKTFENSRSNQDSKRNLNKLMNPKEMLKYKIRILFLERFLMLTLNQVRFKG